MKDLTDAEQRFNELVRAGRVVLPELLADELFEDACYILKVYDERFGLLSSDDAESDARIFLSNELVGLLRIAVLTTAAAIEALANELLDEIGKLSNHEQDSVEEKWELLYGGQGLRPKRGHRPWQGLVKLIKVRNEIAHYKARQVKLLPSGPRGSLTLELFSKDGRFVHRPFEDVVAVAKTYRLAKGDNEEAARLDQFVADDSLFRTLPWEIPDDQSR